MKTTIKLLENPIEDSLLKRHIQEISYKRIEDTVNTAVALITDKLEEDIDPLLVTYYICNTISTISKLLMDTALKDSSSDEINKLLETIK